MAVREAMLFPPTPAALEKNNSSMQDPPPGEVFDLVDESPTTTNHYIQRKEFDALQSQIVSSQQQRMGINFDTIQSRIVSSQQQRMGINFDTIQSQIVSSQQQQRGFNFNTMQSQIISSQQQQSGFNFDTMQSPIVSSQQQQIWIDFDTMSQIFSSQQQQLGINFDTMQSRIVSSQQQESVLSFDTMQSQIFPSQQQQQSEVNTVVSSNEDISPHQQQIEQQVDNQGIDLNKIPEQKPKRKKHRPKVIREGKPVKTPKPVTPKAKTPRPPRNSETPTKKRKYVRKKKELNTLETPSTVLQEIVDPQIQNGTKSARRNLNFDLEDARTRDGFTNNAESQVQEACGVGTTAYPSTNSFIYSSAHAQVTEVENSQAGIAFDLNISVNQLPNEYFETPETPTLPPRQSRQEVMTANHMQSEYVRASENPVPPPQPSGREGQSSKGLPWQKEYMKAISHTERYKESSQKPFDSSKMTDAVLKVTKRDHSLVDACINFIRSNSRTDTLHGSHNTSMQSQDFAKVHKKKRTEDTQNGMTSNASIMLTHTPSSGWKTSNKGPNISETLNSADGRPNNTKVFTFADAQQYMALEKMQASEQASGHMLFNQIQRQIKNRLVQDHTPTSSPATVDCSVISSPVKPAVEHGNIVGCNQPPTPDKLPESKDRQGSEIRGGQAHVKDKDANPQVKPKRGRKKKEQVSVNNIPQNTDQPCLPELEAASWNGGSSFRKPSIQITASSLGNSRENNSHCRISSVQDCQTSSKYRESHASFQSGAIVPYREPIDDIVLKLRHLSIKCVHEDIAVQAQNALVPYVGSNTIVPYEGPFNLTKKRRPRPKVDLDPESNRVWKLLMGSSDDDDAIDPDKEKWWEEERRVFNGRADSFIARMHLVQGDRRFSPWKGSIVDSVVGVFLTQNVSDHLSSSAFMALAARFPIKARDSNSATNTENISRCAAERDGCIIDLEDTTERQGERSGPELNDQSPLVIHETEHVEEKETGNSDELLCSNTGGSTVDYFKVKSLDFHEGEQRIGHASPDSRSGTAATMTDSTSVVEGEDRRSMEDVVSSQNSVVSPQNSPEYLVRTADFGSFSPLSNIEVDDLLTGGALNGLDSKSFMELLQMAETRKFQELDTPGTGRISSTEYFDENNQLAFQGVDKRSSASNQSGYFKGSGPSTATSNYLHLPQHDLTSFSAAASSYYYQSSLNLTVAGMENANNVTEENRSCLPSTALDINMSNKVGVMGRCSSPSAEYSPQATVQKFPLANSCVSVGQQPLLASNCSGTEVCVDKYFCCQSNLTSERTDATSHIQYGNTASFQQKEKVGELHVESSQESVKAQAHMQNCRIRQTFSNSSNNNHNNRNNNNESSNNNHHNPLSSLGFVEAVESNLRYETCTSEKVAAETASNTSKAKKAKADAEKKQKYDWDSLRKKVCSSGAKKERNSNAMDSIDWEAVRCADVSEISHTIRERGMNNMLAERIKEFLNRLVNDHGSIDLEWLRDVPPDKAKDYLLSIRGLGLKSVECVRLLTLHHLAFPVDTNVGRICVRLGWVPLQPLPESLQLHLLEMYPVLETIQKYLWPRLCKLDQRTLYELHYQMITFGKVFCTKSKPNCNACPMRGECKHFASAFASARLALPAPEEKGLMNSTTPVTSEKGHTPNFNPIILPRLEGSMCAQDQSIPRNCEPIIEEPATPEPEWTETPESAIEDAFYEDPEEIPTIKLNLEQFTQNLQNYMHENNMDLQDGDMSKALVAITPEAASIPMPKLKNVSRLRTEHQVYELPDTHPLLEGLDKREPDDPSPYLLAIWTPGETAQSIEPPKVCCDSQDTGKLCDRNTCFGCNSIREAQAQTVRGTLLIPCRTAMRGSFPLNGTYFQVNEVFADHESSRNPIDVPRAWIWNLARRTVYFGTSIPTIFKGLSTEGIQHCFWRGFVCVRGFEQTTRAPRPLYARLHFPASKNTRNKKAAAAAAAKESVVKKTATKSNLEP